ncbi:Rab11 family-interacting protein 5 [Takifugu flavidus]|uniref:Rab11 family-interacting protein 5 n=1 Tax=Takifugu flavidus TaxID=433684 RepID=A0A5C6MKE7_9TELE|nr:Rab11 family-interacting protein 5 [Takifugu flavidus]
MMSLIDLDDDQRWVPTHVNVTVLRARGLRTKGKHGSRYLYTIIQVGKEKYTTGLVEKVEVPEWNEECSFELLPGILEDGGRDAYPAGSADLVLTVMHRVLIGLDVFLGQAIIPLDRIFQEGMCPRDEWFKLNSKSGRKEKERGGLQVTVQFTRNNMTASMFDLTIKDKPRSVFGKLKDRVTGRKRGDVESSSAILPGRYAALSGSLGQPLGEVGGGALEPPDAEITEEKKSKMKEFLKGKLRKSSDTRSCASLASEGSGFSVASDQPPPSLDLLSDPPSSPIYSTKVRVDALYGETDLAKKVLTSQHTTNVLTHKRAFSDEASKIKTSFSRANPAMESLKGASMTQSKSSVCINGSHVYDSEPSTPRGSAAHPCKLVLLEKCTPLSRSLQNLTKRSEDRGSFAEGRRWSFDKVKKEEKEEEKDPLSLSPPARTGSQPVQGATPAVSSTAGSPDKGKKPRKMLFSTGRCESLPAKSDLNQAPSLSDRRLRGWFGSGDSQNKPRLEFSPKVESSSDVPPPIPPRSPVPPLCSPPSTSPSSIFSSDDNHLSPSINPVPPLNSFPPNLHHNPFFEELLAEESQRSPPFLPSNSPFNHTALPCTASPAHDANANIKRERPRPIAGQISLPAQLLTPGPLDPSKGLQSLSDCTGVYEDSFEAFASSRLNSPKASLPPKQSSTSPVSSHGCGSFIFNDAQELQTFDEEPPPLPPRKPVRAPVNEMCSDGWLHRGQELAVHKEAFLLSQTGVASRHRGKEGDHHTFPDSHTSSEASDISCTSQPSTDITSPVPMSEEKLQKFRYEPLEDNRDCLGGMLFEQDLYGRACLGNYRQAKVSTHHLSINAEETKSKITSVSSASRKLLDSVLPVKDLLNLSSLPSKPSLKVLDVPAPQMEEAEASPLGATPTNNGSFSMNLGDLNMNVRNCDSSLADSESSSQTEAADILKSVRNCGETPPKLTLKGSGKAEALPEVFTLKDTYITGMNSSFEITTLMNKRCKGSLGCQSCQCEVGSVKPPNQGSCSPALDLGADTGGLFADFKKTPVDFDDNGNLQEKPSPPNPAGLFPGVISARIRPKRVSRQSSSSSPSSQNNRDDGGFEQLLSLVQSISGANEGPLSYQPVKSALSSILACKNQSDLHGDHVDEAQAHPDTESRSKSPPPSIENSSKFSQVSFEDLHAKVAPPRKTPSKTEPENISPTISSEPHPAHPFGPTLHPSGPSAEARTALTVAPTSSSSSSSSSSSFTTSTSNTDQSLVDALPSLLPEETQPASNLPHLESRTHPVKPLTSGQSEKKESRSVLEKLKSTIAPGWSAQQVTAEPQKIQEVTEDRSAQYQHLTNMELISLLLQQEMDMQKQQAPPSSRRRSCKSARQS